MDERVKQIRKAKGLSQADFAAKLNLSRNFIYMIESGTNGMSERTIADICKVFDVNEVWLRTGIGEMFREHTGNEKISRFFYEVLRDEDDSFRKRLITALADLTPEMWEAAEKFVDKLK